jgi:hypothetical protein
MRRLLVLLLLVAAGVAAPQALAAPPVLLTAGTDNGRPTATWSLPAGEESRFVEVASSPATDSDGFFLASSLEAGSYLDPAQTSWTDVYQLEPGRTYYLHVAGGQAGCSSCPNEFSAIKSFVSDTSAVVNGKANLIIRLDGTGSGTVTSNPGGIDCGTSCVQAYAVDGHVTLFEKPAPGSVFTGWSGGGCLGPAPTCEVVMHVGQTVTATFDLIQPPSLPQMTVARDGTTATATFTVCDDSPGPITISLVQVWKEGRQWKGNSSTTTQSHTAGCDTHTVSGPVAVPTGPLWIAVQVVDVDGRQSSLRTAPAP